jgi:hypothetical protein
MKKSVGMDKDRNLIVTYTYDDEDGNTWSEAAGEFLNEKETLEKYQDFTEAELVLEISKRCGFFQKSAIYGNLN